MIFGYLDCIFEIISHILFAKQRKYAKRIIKEAQGQTPTETAPGTKVYELVEELVRYLPEEMKKQFVD